MGLAIGALLGGAAFIAGLFNLYHFAGGNEEPKPQGTDRRSVLSGGILGVLVGGYFLCITLIFILPRKRAQSVVDQKAALRDYLRSNLADVSPQLFLDYVRVGAVGIDEDLENGTALENYAELGDLAAVRTLIEAGASTAAHGEGQSPPLGSAVDQGHVAAVRLLLSLHADPNLSPAPASTDNLPIFDAVNPSGPDPDVSAVEPDGGGDRAGRGVSVSTADRDPDSTRSLAITSALVAAGGKLDVRDYRSYTPLMIAAATGRCDLVAELLKGNADQTLTDNTGETALTWAQTQHPECAPLLAGGVRSRVALAATLAANEESIAREEAEPDPTLGLPSQASLYATRQQRREENQEAYDCQQGPGGGRGWLGRLVGNAELHLLWWGFVGAIAFAAHHVRLLFRRRRG